ncbi:hypothetical protein UY3_16688 [Chelonia mydas]|uniref:Uncharacterized protein n=1 Tax=Chelonia mydas TaxID=8469 RepID=M7ANV3_CHEMY|nr:hypothetical protein UY3_16688 [Chelonia mydas]
MQLVFLRYEGQAAANRLTLPMETDELSDNGYSLDGLTYFLCPSFNSQILTVPCYCYVLCLPTNPSCGLLGLTVPWTEVITGHHWLTLFGHVAHLCYNIPAHHDLEIGLDWAVSPPYLMD